MVNEIPKFSLSKAKIKTEEELQARIVEQGGGEQKYLRPGKHDVTISSVTYEGKAKDDNWGKFLLTFAGLANKTTTTMLLVPLSDVEYRTADGKVTTFLYTKFRNFMTALGINVTVDTLEDVLNGNFAKPEKTLVGRTVTIDLGYDGNHVKYIGKSEIGEKTYNITMRDGSTLSSGTGQTLTFSDYDSAMAHAETSQISIQKFPSVLSFTPSANLKSVKTASNW